MKPLCRLALVLVVAGIVPVATTAPAAACSCAAGPTAEVEARLSRADAAFVGTYLERNDPLADEPMVTGARVVINRFKVESVQKGHLGGTVEVVSAADESSCGIAPGRGERVGLLVTKTAGGFQSDLCSKVDPGALASAGADRLRGAEMLAAVVAALALLGVIAGIVVGPARSGSLR